MQSVKGEAIERSATLVAVTGATGIRAASGNIDSENLGYAPNAKYSFQDLKFDPEKLSKTNSARQIQFKIYGKKEKRLVKILYSAHGLQIKQKML